MKMSDVKESNGWACCVTYQPVGKLVSVYGVAIELLLLSRLHIKITQHVHKDECSRLG